MDAKLLRSIQRYNARIAITSSSMRGAGSGGVVRSASEFLGDVHLQPFGTSKRDRFEEQLDKSTDELLRRLPRQAQHWGLARKGLNIFLRGCLYTSYLRDHYALALAEEFFELPLDRITGTRLYTESPQGITRWKTVRGINAETSVAYQTAAQRVADKRGIARVHLDAVWWGERG